MSDAAANPRAESKVSLLFVNVIFNLLVRTQQAKLSKYCRYVVPKASKRNLIMWCRLVSRTDDFPSAFARRALALGSD